ncbi:unnamed protein product, partial [Prorocentrum cordatum]
ATPRSRRMVARCSTGRRQRGTASPRPATAGTRRRPAGGRGGRARPTSTMGTAGAARLVLRRAPAGQPRRQLRQGARQGQGQVGRRQRYLRRYSHHQFASRVEQLGRTAPALPALRR